MRGWADLHRCGRDVDAGELLELVVHAGELLADVLLRVGQPFLDPGDIEEHAAVRAAPAGFDLPDDAAGDVIAGEELRRAARVAVSLGVPPAFFGVVGRLAAVVLRDVVEHEAAPLAVSEHPSFTAYALGDEDPLDARRPDHPGRVKLHELHVDELRPGPVGERVPVARAFPAVARNPERAPDAAGRQHDRPGAEHLESPALPLVPEGAGNTPVVEQQRHDGELHVDVESLVDAVILKRPDHLEAGTVADVGKAWVLVAAEVALKDPAIGGAVEERAPGLELPHAVGRLAGVQFGHAPVVHVLTAAHGIGEVHLPAVAVVDVGERRGNASFGHDGVRLAEQRLAEEPDLHPCR